MEQAGSWSLSKLHFHCLNDAFKIACELLVVMMRGYNRHILSVIAKIENYQVKVNEQVLPVGKVGIRGKAVAMRKEQTHAICATVAPHTDFGIIFKHNVKRHTGRGKLEMHEISISASVHQRRD
jgi:hypothetical protein